MQYDTAVEQWNYSNLPVLPQEFATVLQFTLAMQEQEQREQQTVAELKAETPPPMPITVDVSDKQALVVVAEKSKTKLCTHWLIGICSYGDSCWKVHDSSLLMKYQDTFNLTGRYPDLPKSSSYDAAWRRVHAQKELTICVYHLKGSCRFGDLCRKVHLDRQ